MTAAALWLASGAAAWAWLEWLDRRRAELPAILKRSALLAWPVVLPYALRRREDLTRRRALLLALALVAPFAGPSAAPAAVWVVRVIEAVPYAFGPSFVPAPVDHPKDLFADGPEFTSCPGSLVLAEPLPSSLHPVLRDAGAPVVRPLGKPVPSPVDPSEKPDDWDSGYLTQDQREAARYWNWGIIAFQRGRIEEARKEWTACLQLDPDQEDCRKGLARLDGS